MRWRRHVNLNKQNKQNKMTSYAKQSKSTKSKSTNYSIWVFNGTALDILIPISVEEMTKNALQMVMGMLSTPEFYKDTTKLGDFLYNQTAVMEQVICNNSQKGIITEKCIKDAAKFAEESVDKFRALYCGNIAAMLILNRVPNDEDFGSIEIESLFADWLM